MENNIVIIKKKHYKIVSNSDIQLAFDLETLPIHPNIVIICSTSINEFANILLKENKNVIHIYPSIACMFCLNCANLLYIDVLEIENELHCLIEIVLDKNYMKCKTKYICGNLDNVINDICLAICDIDKKVLCENIYVDGEIDLKKNIEERLMMELGKGINVKHMKFLKVKNEIKDSLYCHEGIKEDPVAIGGLMASDIIFNKGNGQFMTKVEYEQGDYSNLSPFD